MNSQQSIRVLVIEDVMTDAELEIRELRRAGMRVEHRLADSEESFRREIGRFAPDIIISDFSMPHFDGMQALALSRELSPDVPFLFVSGTIGEEYAIRALKNGATDYVLKTNLVRLPASVERALDEARERRAHREAERKLAETRERLQSIYDSLPDALWSVELPVERIAYMSEASSAVYGHPPEAFLADKDLWKNVIHADDRPRVEAAWRNLVEAGAPFDVEYRVLGPDGSQRWVNDRGRQIRDRAGRVVRIDGLARDISDLVRQRERLGRLNRIRDLLGAANAAFMRNRERRSLFDEFCRIAVARGGFVLARLVALNGDGEAQVAASAGEAGGAFAQVLDEYNRNPAVAQSLLARALRSGQPVISNDMAADGRVAQRAELTRQGNYSLVILPIRVDGKVVAAAILRAREAQFFDQEELGLLSEMVANLEFALELQEKQDQLNYLALYDPLTGLPNRTLFQDRLTLALEAARRGPSMLSLTVFDIERFKAINDAYGEKTGDEVLRGVARRLREAVGDVNRVARLGGNMFAVLRPAIQDAADAARILEEKTSVIGQPLVFEDREIKVTAKAGIALFPDDGADADTLFRNAEASLKRAKETGDRFLFYAPHINARVAEQVELENRLRHAVEQREFFLHFQPKVAMDTNRIVGLEALMRWRGPDKQLMSPARFVPVLEETGLILEAGRLALEMAAGVQREWKAGGLDIPRIAVNVSALQLRQRSFVDDVLAAVGGPGGGVDLEITESLLMDDIEESIRKLRALREAGANIALDDFGTGHSSLAYLSRLPIDTVKIDRSFTRAMTENADSTSIVSTIISLAQALRLKVVAEGVETEEQARMLRLLRCDQMQGYLFSPPQPKEDIALLLRAQQV